MMKKVWLMLVLCSLMVVVGCSGKSVKEDLQTVSVETTSENMDVTADTECDLEKDASGEAEVDELTSEADGDSDTDADADTDTDYSEQETSSDKEESTGSQPVVSEEPATERPDTQVPTSEPTTSEPSTEAETDEGDNPADGSPVVEITINRPEAEYTGYDPNRVASLAIDKCKAAGMISLPENLDNLLAEGKITQEEYNEYYPYDGCGYYSVFVETNLNLASTISGSRLYSEEEIADYIAGMMVLEVEPYFYIECAGTYQGNSTAFYEFRCYR